MQGPASTLYYLSSEGTRYVFSNEGTYYSWYSGFNEVNEISIDELITYPLAGNVTYRPGYRLVKITTDPKVYAVSNSGILRWITSETMAQRLYGSDWNTKVDDIPDEFFINYVIGDPIEDDADYDPIVVSQASMTIGADLNLAVSSGATSSDTWIDIGDAEAIRAAEPSPVVTCTTDTWTCSLWSDCPLGLQTRSCILTDDCAAVETPMPSIARSCEAGSPPELAADEPVCIGPDDSEVWTCQPWGECSAEGTRTRSCELTTDCTDQELPQPDIQEACDPTPPHISLGLTDNENSTTVEPGAQDVPMLTFTVTPKKTDLHLLSVNLLGFVDENRDGTFAIGEENGVSFNEMVEECALFEGDTNLAGYWPIGNGQIAGVGLLAVNYNISADDTKTFTMKCNILESAGTHDVALVLSGQAGVIPITGSASEIETLMLTEHTSPLPLNGNGSTTADIVVHVVEPVVEPVVPVVSLVALPSTSLSSGAVVVSRFVVFAEEQVALKHLTFNADLNTTNEITITVGSGSSIREVGLPTNIAGAASMSGSLICVGTGAFSCVIEVGFDEEQIIAAASSKAYDLILDISGILTGGDSLFTMVRGDSSSATGGLSQIGGAWDYRVGESDDNFVWSDMSAVSHSDTLSPSGSDDWHNGADVIGLPSDTLGLTK